MFENPEIDLDALPKVADLHWQDLDEKYARRKIVDSAIALVFMLLGVFALQTIFRTAIADDELPLATGWLWLIPIAFALPMFGWPLMSVPKKGFALRDKDIIYKSGVFWHTITAIPFNRIQHVEKSSTPLDRKFRLASLQLYTAGGSGGDLHIHGLPAKTAEKLRIFILGKIGATLEKN